MKTARVHQRADRRALEGEPPGRDPGEHPALVQLEQPRERDPAEHERVRPQPRRLAWLPNPRVRHEPPVADDLAEPAEHRLRFAVEARAAADRLRDGVDDLAVDVELVLPGGGVAAPHRPGAAVPHEVGQELLRLRR